MSVSWTALYAQPPIEGLTIAEKRRLAIIVTEHSQQVRELAAMQQLLDNRAQQIASLNTMLGLCREDKADLNGIIQVRDNQLEIARERLENMKPKTNWTITVIGVLAAFLGGVLIGI